MSETLLEVDGLRTHFFTKAGVVKAVDDVSFTVERGEVLGLVGESGSGKSITGYSIMGLVDPPGRIVAGRLRLDGRDLRALAEEDLRQLRGNRIAMIFQDPMMTLNPVLRIDAQMVEAILAHRKVGRSAAREQARAALARVGIPSPDERLTAYPHQFSGGMRQRVAIAIALAERPGPRHRRRADDRARRDDPGTDPVRDAEARSRNRRRADLDHARPVGDCRARRPRLRDVRGPDRRAGERVRRAFAAAASVHARAARLGAGDEPRAARGSRRFPAWRRRRSTCRRAARFATAAATRPTPAGRCRKCVRSAIRRRRRRCVATTRSVWDSRRDDGRAQGAAAGRRGHEPGRAPRRIEALREAARHGGADR